jgi:DNA (cytosine-5)-methyltransferase 1
MLSIRAAVGDESRSNRMKAAPLRSMQNEPVWAKIARLQRGGVPRVLDLFAGCGGLSLGLQRAGFEILAGLDSDPHASASHALNFHAGCPRHALPQDLTDPEVVTPENVCARLGIGRPDDSVDVVVGGPPCQAFARIGRAKLREIAGDPEAFLKDPRAGLHERWLAWVRELEPLAVLVENVPDALSAGGRNIAEEIALELDELGFVTRYTLLNAVHYGVPQTRERMFLLGLRKEYGQIPTFPCPTHAYHIPRGYQQIRRATSRALRIRASLLARKGAGIGPMRHCFGRKRRSDSLRGRKGPAAQCLTRSTAVHKVSHWRALGGLAEIRFDG